MKLLDTPSQTQPFLLYLCVEMRFKKRSTFQYLPFAEFTFSNVLCIRLLCAQMEIRVNAIIYAKNNNELPKEVNIFNAYKRREVLNIISVSI